MHQRFKTGNEVGKEKNREQPEEQMGEEKQRGELGGRGETERARERGERETPGYEPFELDASPILYETTFNLKLSGNEVYCMNAVRLQVKNMLCGKLHCQKGSNLTLFAYKILGDRRRRRSGDQPGETVRRPTQGDGPETVRRATRRRTSQTWERREQIDRF